MKDTTLFACSMDTTFEKDISLISNNVNKKKNRYDFENMISNFSETSSLVNSKIKLFVNTQSYFKYLKITKKKFSN